jgi:hypothetical protein
MKVWAELDGYQVRATLDSGSQVNLVSRDWVEAMAWTGIQPRLKKVPYSASNISG